MKKLFVILLASFCYISLSAQDLIVTSQNDSINCKVSKVDQDNIFFTSNGQSTVMPLIKVKTCLYNFYKQKLPVNNITLPDDEESAEETSPMPEEVNYKRFRFALNGGPSYRTYSIDDGMATNLTNYYSKLRLGYSLEGDASYFYNSRRGFGLKFSYYKASNSLDSACFVSNGFLNEGKISDDLSILYAAPSFSTRIHNLGSRNSFYLTVSIGYMYYSNKQVTINRFDITGSTLGFSLDFDYDVAVSDRLAVGIMASVYSGSLSKISQTDSSGATTNYSCNESLSRIDLGIGLRF